MHIISWRETAAICLVGTRWNSDGEKADDGYLLGYWALAYDPVHVLKSLRLPAASCASGMRGILQKSDYRFI